MEKSSYTVNVQGDRVVRVTVGYSFTPSGAGEDYYTRGSSGELLHHSYRDHMCETMEPDERPIRDEDLPPSVKSLLNMTA